MIIASSIVCEEHGDRHIVLSDKPLRPGDQTPGGETVQRVLWTGVEGGWDAVFEMLEQVQER